jgi:hypothetical protein
MFSAGRQTISRHPWMPEPAAVPDAEPRPRGRVFNGNSVVLLRRECLDENIGWQNSGCRRRPSRVVARSWNDSGQVNVRHRSRQRLTPERPAGREDAIPTPCKTRRSTLANVGGSCLRANRRQKSCVSAATDAQPIIMPALRERMRSFVPPMLLSLLSLTSGERTRPRAHRCSSDRTMNDGPAERLGEGIQSPAKAVAVPPEQRHACSGPRLRHYLSSCLCRRGTNPCLLFIV